MESTRLPERLRGPRAIALIVGSACVVAALLQHGAPHWALLCMAVHALAWPPLAYRLASRSAAPTAAEHRNLVIDCALASAWLPAIGFNAIPSTLLLTMVTLDALAIGGPGLMLRGLAASLAGAGAGCLLLPVRVELASSVPTLLACMPVLIGYPLITGSVMYKLSQRLGERRRQIERSEKLYRDTLDAMQAGIVLYDAEDRLVLCNETFRRLHRPIAELLVPGERHERVLRAALDHDLLPEARGREDAWVAEQLDRRRAARPARNRELADGSWRSVLDQRLSDGSLLSFSTDITELVRRGQELQRLNGERDDYASRLREVNARLEQLSQTDALTGLANRRLFDQRLRDESRRARQQGWWLALVILDVDHFKRFNDRHGHLGGDACLLSVAQALQTCARRTSDLVARYGGEEFVLLLPHTTLQEAAAVAEHCIGVVDEARIAHGDSPVGGYVTVSVGTAAMKFAPGDDGDLPELVRRADRALYRAKAKGRHRLELAEDALPA